MFNRNSILRLLTVLLLGITIFFHLNDKNNSLATSNASWNATFFNNKTLSGAVIESTTNRISYYLGYTSPDSTIKSNGFSAQYEKNISVDGKTDYFLHSYANDGIRMYLNDKLYINSWKNSNGEFHAQYLPKLKKGNYKVKSQFYENTGKAAFYADIIPFGDWIGYFYDNSTVKGTPIGSLIYSNEKGSLSFNYEYGKPNIKNIPSNNYSTKLYTYRRLNEGDYLIHLKTEDGVKVYIDGEKVIDYWSNKSSINEVKKIKVKDNLNSKEKNVHEIKIYYRDKQGKSSLDFTINSLKDELTSENWLSVYYNNPNLIGLGNVIGGTGKINNIFFDWGYTSPNSKLNKDKFSASYYKLLKKGDYYIHSLAGDGIKAAVNGETVFNSWSNSGGKETKGAITGLSSSNNVLTIDYFENTKKAHLFSDVVPLGDWIAYYYENTKLQGNPKEKQIYAGNSLGKLSFDLGYNAPVSGFRKNNYSAEFSTAVKLEEGMYALSTSGYNGIKVYIDDKLVVDRWSAGQKGNQADIINISDNKKDGQIHFLRVEYYEKSGKSKLDFKLEPISNLISASDWLQIIYPNNTLSGKGSIIGDANNKVKQVQYNWGSKEAFPGYGKDEFSVSFLKKINGNQDYYGTTFANDGIRVKLDDELIVNKWNESEGVYNNYLLTNLASGEHTLQTDYFENSGEAAVYTDVQPLGIWTAYFYNNRSTSGFPVSRKIIKSENDLILTQNFGNDSPEASIKEDSFSARYYTAKRIKAGEYIIRGLSDDGVRVYIDGKLVVDSWRNGGYSEKAAKVKIEDINKDDVHWIEVRYYDYKSNAKFQVSFTPYEESQVVDSTGWLAEFYPEKIGKTENPSYPLSERIPVVMGGKDSLTKLEDIHFDWGYSSPDAAIPEDNFSAIFKRKVKISEEELYNLTVKADDGVILKIDEKTVIDSWKSTSNPTREVIGYKLTKGTHTFELRYYDYKSKAYISFDMEKSKTVSTMYADSSKSLKQIVDIQMTRSPQTDKNYKTYVREDAMTLISSGEYGVLNGDWNVRGGPSTNYWIVGTLGKYNKVEILSKSEKDSSGKYWYEINYSRYWIDRVDDIPGNYYMAYHTWVNASPSDVSFYVNPKNFINNEKQKFQFLDLSSTANLSVSEVNSKILNNKGILTGKASSFIKAGEQYNVNEIYLISHALLETGNGLSTLAKGIKVSSVNGKKVEPKVVYNMYGIGAYDSSAIKSGSERAYLEGWDTPEKAIIGGAKFIGENYINNSTYKQNTLYKMRWNPGNPGVHQYATDIGWASKQVSKIHSLYDLLSTYRINLEVPEYK